MEAAGGLCWLPLPHPCLFAAPGPEHPAPPPRGSLGVVCRVMTPEGSTPWPPEPVNMVKEKRDFAGVVK